ncbi:MAG: methylated-DNA--[protein]-cysteine S-methyltransferase [Planctomycetota bacterium]|jgi:methylated-DNA-[protein]-cysteine S-methyltransferase|nr:methylated-DNA--[protein]-cysteine S-methyltransferase [Planctomycetota bacterium]
MKKAQFFATAMGTLGVAESGGRITDVFLDGEAGRNDCRLGETPTTRAAARQLREYLAGTRRRFDLPLKPEGTDFELAVWAALLEIPYGETRSYRQIAERIGRPGACRAVGGANARNRIGIIIPCHRVIGANGALTGYAGGLDLKGRLLALEGAR